MAIVRLGDICEKIGSGATPRGGKEAYCNEGISLVRSQNVLDFGFSNDGLAYINEEQAQKLKNVEVQAGDVLLNITGDSTARACIMDSTYLPARVNQHVAIVRGKVELVQSSYILYFLQWKKKYLIQLASAGATRNALTKGMIEKLELNLPSLREQKKIVSILDLIQSKIKLNQKINDNLHQQARTLLAQWQIEHEGEYDFSLLSDVAVINPDTYSPKDAWEYVNYLDTSSITDGIISEVQCIKPLTEKLPSRARRIISANDVVFSTVRPNQHHFGIITEPLENMLASTGFAVIRSCHPLVSNELLYLCLTENSFIEKMQQLAEQSTSTFPSIKPSDLGVCKIPCPIDQDLSDALNTLFACITANQRENTSLSALRDTLLPKLMSGEIDVSDIQF